MDWLENIITFNTNNLVATPTHAQLLNNVVLDQALPSQSEITQTVHLMFNLTNLALSLFPSARCQSDRDEYIHINTFREKFVLQFRYHHLVDFLVLHFLHADFLFVFLEFVFE